MIEDIKKKKFKRMDLLHHILAGFKSSFTENLLENIDSARRACGGAGFTANSGFAEIWQDCAPLPTYEGENTVMMLQASRYLFKLVKRSEKGE